eukprot:3968127-Prymnesium_polylepis.1
MDVAARDDEAPNDNGPLGVANGEAAAQAAAQAAAAGRAVPNIDGMCDCCGELTLNGAAATRATLGTSRCERCKGAVLA